jgi:hypothetical protein
MDETKAALADLDQRGARRLTILDPERLASIAGLGEALVQLWTRPAAQALRDVG